MIINPGNIDTIFTGYKASFAKGFDGAPSHWQKVAMKTTSITRQETYGWLGQFPKMREWLGDRVINMLTGAAMTVVNKDYESTIAVPRNDIEDDTYGIFSPMMEEMGRSAAENPDELVFQLLASGFTRECYDTHFFFDTDHPVTLNGHLTSVANTDGGDGPPWFLLDTSRATRPLLYQERRAPNFVSKTGETDDNVFFRKEYIYGVDSRGAAALGFWQMAWGSKQPLNAANYQVARAAMQSLKGDEGRPLGIKPTLLVVGPAQEAAALALINSQTLANGESNKWFGSVDLLVTPWII